MKRKYIIISLFLFLGITKIFATEMRWYYDDKTGCSGYAGANYIGTTKEINPVEFAKEGKQRVINFGATI